MHEESNEPTNPTVTELDVLKFLQRSYNKKRDVLEIFAQFFKPKGGKWSEMQALLGRMNSKKLIKMSEHPVEGNRLATICVLEALGITILRGEKGNEKVS